MTPSAVVVMAIVGALTCHFVLASEDSVSPERGQLASGIQEVLSATGSLRQLDDSSDWALVNHPRTRALYSQSSTYLNEAIALISDPSANTETKQMAVRFMQCLPIERYLEFLRDIADQVRDGAASPLVLAVAVFPGEEWGDVIVRNYQRNDVRALLLEIRATGLGETVVADRIDWALDGRTAGYLNHLRDTGTEVPALECSSAESE